MERFPITHFEYCLNLYSLRDSVDYINTIMTEDDVEFEAFAKKLTDEKNNLPFPTTDESLRLSLEMLFHIWRLKETGSKVFYISKDLCEVLSSMNLTIDCEFLQAPFEEIYLYLDQDDITITDHTGTKPVKGIYVNLQRYSSYHRKFRFLATSGAKGIEDGYDINNYASFLLPEHGELEYVLDAHLETFKKTKVSEVSFDAIRKIYRMTVNILLYLSSNNADLFPIQPVNIMKLAQSKKSSSKRDKLLRQAKTSASLPFILVGKNVKAYQSTIGGAGVKLSHKVRVSGHWRGQWRGSDKEGTRKKEIIRIESYIKGSDFTEEINKHYLVK